MKKVAINGFGRIGRMVLRSLCEKGITNFKVVAINDLSSIEDNAHLFKYDSIHSKFKGDVKINGNNIDVGFGDIKIIKEASPEKLPWKELDIDIVFECSGRFTTKDDALKHINAGAKKVIVSAPATNADITVVYGINHQDISKEHQIISNASCTTNCLAPIVSVIDDAFGIEMGYMTTIHAYTGDQRLVDSIHSDMRRARAAATSMIPSSTGAAKAIGLVLPQLNGKLDGVAIRVPVANVSVVDLKCMLKTPTDTKTVNEIFKKASMQNNFKGVLEYIDEPLVSVDFNGNSHSSCFDATQSQVVNKTMLRVLSWYDNEWGFSNRMIDVGNHLSMVM